MSSSHSHSHSYQQAELQAGRMAGKHDIAVPIPMNENPFEIPYYKQSPAPAIGKIDAPDTEWRDLPFAVLFAVGLAGTAAIGVTYGGPAIHKRPQNATESADIGIVLLCLWIGTLVAVLVSTLWVMMFRSHGSAMIRISLYANIAFLSVAALISFGVGQLAMGAFYVLCAGASGLYFYLVRQRIPFTAVIMKSASDILRHSVGPFVVSFLTSLIAVGWTVVWSFTFYALFTSNNELSSGEQAMVFFLFIELFWVLQVLKNLSLFTTAGWVASHIYQPPQTTLQCFSRGISTSFGSICLGSLLVAIIMAVRSLLQNVRDRSRDSIVVAIVDCLLSIVEGIVRQLNTWAYVECAIFGVSYRAAATRVFDLFKARGFDGLVTQDLSGTVLVMGNLLAGASSGIVGGAWAAGANLEAWTVIGILAFIIGFALSTLITSVVESAVLTIFVVLAEDSAVFAYKRPSDYESIVQSSKGVDTGGFVVW